MKLTWKNPTLRALAIAGMVSALLGGGAQGIRLPQSRAADTRKPDPADDDKEVVTSKASRRTPAKSVNFNKALGLPFDSLRSLGSRIDTARRKEDPVALANAASELSVAEKVSGKTAGVTSKELMQEAAQLAAARKRTAELQALVHMSNQVQIADSEVANLRDQPPSSRRRPRRRRRRSCARRRRPTRRARSWSTTTRRSTST